MGRLAVFAAFALALTLGFAACGGGDGGGAPGSGSGGDGAPSDSSPSAEEAREKQEEADAEVRERNAEVRKEYRERQRAAAPTEQEVEAKASTEAFYEILGDDEGGKKRTTIDSAAFCELMTEQARRQTADYARQASGEAKDWDCERAIELLVLRAKQTGGFKHVRQAEVVGVNAEGDRATASVRFGKGPITSIALVREDGEWKLAASPSSGGGSGP